MIAKPIKVHTILFTEACPLNCRYCDLQNDTGYEGCKNMTKENFFDLVNEYDKNDNQDEVITRILFTGGEPLLYWDWIKEVIEKYQHRFQYSFNTSGYLFTEEILKFLSPYQVNFTLSVDGGEKLTNYLRPVRGNETHTGYFKQLKKILPTLLYYFPLTPFRIIIGPRYVDLLYEQYLEAERCGFKYFTFILDFESRPAKELRKNKKQIFWTKETEQILQEQVNLIIQDILIGFHEDVKKPQFVDMNNVLNFMLNKKTFNAETLPCGIFNNRSLSTIYNKYSNHCFYSFEQDLMKIKKQLNDKYQQLQGKCPLQESCIAFEYCAQTCCPQLCLSANGDFFNFDSLECLKNKVVYNGALFFLDMGNTLLSNNFLYIQFIKTLIESEVNN